jgi:hypothetical protein
VTVDSTDRAANCKIRRGKTVSSVTMVVQTMMKGECLVRMKRFSRSGGVWTDLAGAKLRNLGEPGPQRRT